MMFNLKVKLADNSANNSQEFSFTSNNYNDNNSKVNIRIF